MPLPEHALKVAATIAGFYTYKNEALRVLEKHLALVYEEFLTEDSPGFKAKLNDLLEAETELFEKRIRNKIPRTIALLELQFATPTPMPPHKRVPLAAYQAEMKYTGSLRFCLI